MAEDRIDPSVPIPEADFLDQQTPVDAQALIDTTDPLPRLDQRNSFVDEADLLEQATPLLGDEEDYPPTADARSW